jgi:CRISPR-associated protein Cas2
MRHFYVISYDVPDDRRRSRIARALLGYGERVQRSVFECILDDSQYAALRARLERLIKPGEDSVRTYRLGPESRAGVDVDIQGLGARTEAPAVYVV